MEQDNLLTIFPIYHLHVPLPTILITKNKIQKKLSFILINKYVSTTIKQKIKGLISFIIKKSRTQQISCVCLCCGFKVSTTFNNKRETYKITIFLNIENKGSYVFFLT